MSSSTSSAVPSANRTSSSAARPRGVPLLRFLTGDEVGQQAGQHPVLRRGGGPGSDAGQLGQLVLRRLLGTSAEHVLDLADEPAEDRCLLRGEVGQQMAVAA